MSGRWVEVAVGLVVGVLGGCGSSGSGCPSDLGMRDAVRPDIGQDGAPPDIGPDESGADPVPEAGDVATDDATADPGPLDRGDPADTTGPDTPKDLPAEVVNPTDPIPPITQPVPLRAGVAVLPMPVPVGINTAGFGAQSGAKTPFTVDFPGTDSVYMHPNIKAVFVEGGMGRLVFVRLDTVGISSTARESILMRLSARTGHDFGDELVVGGTHTHSGPGRMMVGAFEVLIDRFFPEFYDRMMTAVADAVIAAYHDLAPARFGYAFAHDSLLHSDRRCENPDMEAGDMPLLRFDALDGRTKAVILTYAIHGTVLGADMHHLSQDVSGAIERKVEEGFDHPVPVLFFNSWAGDMAPGASLPPSDPGPYSVIPGAYTRCEGLGNRAAQTAGAVWPTIPMRDTADVSSRTVWIPLNREAIGYGEGEFPYEWGAVYCGGGGGGNCWSGEPQPVSGLDTACLFFPQDMPAPDRTLVTVGRIGDLAFATFPGEAVTSIGVALRDEVSALAGGADVAIFGYAQDYTGYSTPEWDWWQGGYEAAGAIWGPKQGDYLTARIRDAARLFFAGTPLPFTPPSPSTPPEQAYDPRGATGSLDPGQVVQDVLPTYGPTDTVVFRFAGGDPWLGTPVVTLHQRQGETYVPFLRANGTPVDSDGYEFSLRLDPDPSYFAAPKAGARRFVWTATLPLKRVADQRMPISPGTYRLSASGWFTREGQCPGAVCTREWMDMTSSSFDVSGP